MNSFGVMVRVGIRVYVKPFCSTAKLNKKPKSRENLGERISKSPAARCMKKRLKAVEKIEKRLKSGDT